MNELKTAEVRWVLAQLWQLKLQPHKDRPFYPSCSTWTQPRTPDLLSTTPGLTSLPTCLTTLRSHLPPPLSHLSSLLSHLPPV